MGKFDPVTAGLRDLTRNYALEKKMSNTVQLQPYHKDVQVVTFRLIAGATAGRLPEASPNSVRVYLRTRAQRLAVPFVKECR